MKPFFLAALALFQPAEFKQDRMIQRPVNANYPCILLLHGSQESGWRSISPQVNAYWIEKGFAVAAVSMPGYGLSSGKKDFCGPCTIDALNFAIDEIKNELNVSQITIIGFGQRAIAALLLAAQRIDIQCLICANAGYDLLRHQAADDPLMGVLREKYDLDCNDEKALIVRSPLYHISKITAPIFLLHRRGNPIINEQEAIDFHKAMLAAGKECHLVIKDKTLSSDEQKLSFEEILLETESWLLYHNRST